MGLTFQQKRARDRRRENEFTMFAGNMYAGDRETSATSSTERETASHGGG